MLLQTYRNLFLNRIPTRALKIFYSLSTMKTRSNKTFHEMTFRTRLILFQLVLDINAQIALFRDLLVNIGQSRDCPEHRERIRKLRRSCVEACKSTSQMILPHIQRLVLLINIIC